MRVHIEGDQRQMKPQTLTKYGHQVREYLSRDGARMLTEEDLAMLRDEYNALASYVQALESAMQKAFQQIVDRANETQHGERPPVRLDESYEDGYKAGRYFEASTIAKLVGDIKNIAGESIVESK